MTKIIWGSQGKTFEGEVDYQITIPTSGLTYYYPMNAENISGSNATDVVSNNTIEFDSAISLTTDHNSNSNSAILGGCGLGTSINNHSFSGSDNFTYSFWFNSIDNVQIFFDLSSPVTNEYFQSYYFGPGDGFYVNVGNNGSTIWVSASSILHANWYHVIVTKDGNTASLYINNVFKDSETHTSISDVPSDKIYIGSDGWSNVNKISQIAIYDRVLTTQERADLYANS